MNKITRVNIIALLIILAAAAGCKKSFLDKPPLSAVTDASFYKTDDQALAGTALLYNMVWFN